VFFFHTCRHNFILTFIARHSQIALNLSIFQRLRGCVRLTCDGTHFAIGTAVLEWIMEMSLRLALVTFLLALTLGAIGCADARRDSNSDLNHAQQGSPVRQADGSTIMTSTSPDGKKTETRTFASAEIASVTRTTYPDQTQRGVVEYSDGRTVEIKDDHDIGALMETSVDDIKAVASKARSAAADFGEEVADKTKTVGDQAADQTKAGLEKAKNAAADATAAAGEGIKKAGKEIKKAGEKVKDKVSQ
jgi:hypothetical protein